MALIGVDSFTDLGLPVWWSAIAVAAGPKANTMNVLYLHICRYVTKWAWKGSTVMVGYWGLQRVKEWSFGKRS